MTAHWRVVTAIPVSLLMAGNRMLTAEVLALTTSVEMQVAASTPLAWDPVRPGLGALAGAPGGRRLLSHQGAQSVREVLEIAKPAGVSR